MPARLTRVVRFRARHHYGVAAWSEAENRTRLGSLVAPHDHDYECGVTVSGELDPRGMVIDLALLDRIVAEEVRGPLEGADLNQVVPAFRTGDEQPTCEALARFLFDRIAPRLPHGVALTAVRVAEDPSLAAEYFGPA